MQQHLNILIKGDISLEIEIRKQNMKQQPHKITAPVAVENSKPINIDIETIAIILGTVVLAGVVIAGVTIASPFIAAAAALGIAVGAATQ